MHPRMELTVGKDIFSVCGKCGDTWHVIVAMNEAQVSKVQCKQCSGYHRYRAPAGEANVNRRSSATSRRAAASKAKNAASRRTSAVVTAPQVEPDLSRPVRTYTMRDTYEPGERIEHPKFGRGVVESTSSPGKIDVFFQDGRRTLAHGRGTVGSARVAGHAPRGR